MEKVFNTLDFNNKLSPLKWSMVVTGFIILWFVILATILLSVFPNFAKSIFAPNADLSAFGWLLNNLL